MLGAAPVPQPSSCSAAPCRACCTQAPCGEALGGCGALNSRVLLCVPGCSALPAPLSWGRPNKPGECWLTLPPAEFVAECCVPGAWSVLLGFVQCYSGCADVPDVLVALPNITVRILNLSKFHFFSVGIILWKDQVQ